MLIQRQETLHCYFGDGGSFYFRDSSIQLLTYLLDGCWKTCGVFRSANLSKFGKLVWLITSLKAHHPPMYDNCWSLIIFHKKATCRQAATRRSLVSLPSLWIFPSILVCARWVLIGGDRIRHIPIILPITLRVRAVPVPDTAVQRWVITVAGRKRQ